MLRPPRHRRAAIALVALALTSSACAGSAPPDDVASLRSPGASAAAASSAPSPDAQEAFLDYTACMRDQGIDMPDPDFSDGGTVLIGPGPAAGPGDEANEFGGEEFRAADEVCGHLLADVAPPAVDPERQAEMQAQMLALAQCMRDHGIDMPDPRPGEGTSITIGGPHEEVPFDPSSKEFQEAHRACASELDLPLGDGRGVGPAPGGQP